MSVTRSNEDKHLQEWFGNPPKKMTRKKTKTKTHTYPMPCNTLQAIRRG